MNLSVTFCRAARAEFIEAAAWCESRSGPRRTRRLTKDVRRVVANRFPLFSVYFRAEERRIVVLAVSHGRRNPVIWQDLT